MLKKVSIVMCTYNGAVYLAEQLDSLLAQTYPLHEILVQDDGSTDDTWAILEQYAKANDIIKICRNEGVHGINGNFFSALKKATGDFIAISDQDDIWEKDKIAKQVGSIANSWMCGGFSKPFSSDGFPIRWDVRKPCLHVLRLCYLSEIPGHVQLFRKELLKYLPNQEEVPYLYDWQLQFLASAAEKLTFIDDVLVNFRRHSDAATATKPISNKGMEGLRTFFFLLRNYHVLHEFTALRFSRIQKMIESLQQNHEEFRTESAYLALKLSAYYQNSGVFNYLKMTAFCLRHRDKIFHAREKNSCKSLLQAIYFPLYSMNYYRGIIK